ncbi:hypothetical protein [Sphingobium sp. KCTC 72723]|uniref:hypothetical protein n=1 Tax=Sphingobium sp. KCTC 72723 TaxID=2733867 RepID=UPI00165DBB64|nr:hypothetical protein [Sphingobium sp. KCTC 72723]
MSENLDLDPAFVQRLAETEIANVLESKKALLEEHSASFRWLVASFLAINGGGVLALAGQQNIPRGYAVTSGLLFCMGILSALLCAWLSQRANRAMMRSTSETLGFWLSVAHTGELDQEHINAIERKMHGTMKAARPTQFSGWLSVLAFAFGMLVAGNGYWIAHSPEMVKVCVHD